mgnify:CR=1 FL=1
MSHILGAVQPPLHSWQDGANRDPGRLVLTLRGQNTKHFQFNDNQFNDNNSGVPLERPEQEGKLPSHKNLLTEPEWLLPLLTHP